MRSRLPVKLGSDPPRPCNVRRHRFRELPIGQCGRGLALKPLAHGHSADFYEHPDFVRADFWRTLVSSPEFELSIDVGLSTRSARF
jgi:hypothetical protein